MGLTGSLDKAILEAYSAGVPVVTCNTAAEGVILEYRDTLLYPIGDHEALARLLYKNATMSKEERDLMMSTIRARILKDHSIERLIKTILSFYNHI
jgi:glycosyltransferase involved in cell wall biosynthesis